MYHSYLDLWKEHLHAGLKEDGWPWDWTSLGTLAQKHPKMNPEINPKINPKIKKTRGVKVIAAKVIGKEEGVWAAESLVQSLSKVATNIQAKSELGDGIKFGPGSVLVRISGTPMELLALERPFLNLADMSVALPLPHLDWLQR